MILTPYLAEAGRIVARRSGMSNIVLFKMDKVRSVSQIESGESAQILLFTGVRYIRDEEWAAEAEQDAAQRAPARAQDSDAPVERLLA